LRVFILLFSFLLLLPLFETYPLFSGSTQLATCVRRKEKGLISVYEDYMAAHSTAGGASAGAAAAAKPSAGGAGGSSEEIKVIVIFMTVFILFI
jgi:hypothetical protein